MDTAQVLADLRDCVDRLYRWQDTPFALRGVDDARTVLTVLADVCLPTADDELRRHLLAAFNALDEIEANLKEHRDG